MSSNSRIPMQMDVKIYPQHSGGNVLASASVTLNGCFAIRGVRVIEGRDGVFASMPSYKTRNGHKDVCFPCTREFRQQFNDAVAAAYRQALNQQQDTSSQEQQAPQELEEPPVSQVSM